MAPVNLEDGTNVKFKGHARYYTIEYIDWRNLIHCSYLNLSDNGKLVFLNIKYLQNLRVLIIWGCGIKEINLTELIKLELVVAGDNQLLTTR